MLGVRSHEKHTQDEHAQTVMKLFAGTTRLLFVGCGAAGLSDPNWGPFLDWLAEDDKTGEHVVAVGQQPKASKIGIAPTEQLVSACQRQTRLPRLM